MWRRREMTWREQLFTYHGIVSTLVHDAIIGGILLGAVIFAVQWYGVDVTFQVPTIEHVFKKGIK
jgi:hypothetical protein